MHLVGSAVENGGQMVPGFGATPFVQVPPHVLGVGGAGAGFQGGRGGGGGGCGGTMGMVDGMPGGVPPGPKYKPDADDDAGS